MLEIVEGTCFGSDLEPQKLGPSDCLPKTQVSANPLRRCIGTDACPVLEG